MIGNLLFKIAELINGRLNPGGGSTDPNNPVIIGNVSQLESSDDGITNGLEDKIIVSLVNVEQDAPLRNGPTYTPTNGNAVKYHNPPIYLNLYVLFSANNKFDITKWEGHLNSLNSLTRIIAFFQRNNVFTAADLGIITPPLENLQFEKLIFDQYSMSFEQLNHLWGILGGKYLPSVLYKVRLVSVFVDEGNEGSIVKSIDTKGNILN